MNYNNLLKQAQAHYDSVKDAADVEPAKLGFYAGYEAGYDAGQRAERERIADKLDKIYEQPSETDRHWVVLDFNSELRADPAESGE